jgi:hypothetical protein
MAEQERIRGQVREFLAYLSNLEDNVMADHLKSLPIVVTTLQQLIGDSDLDVCISSFCQRFVTPGHAAVDLTNWNTVRRLQNIMGEFAVAGFYEDPASECD